MTVKKGRFQVGVHHLLKTEIHFDVGLPGY
jgi:hypothetical protein